MDVIPSLNDLMQQGQERESVGEREEETETSLSVSFFECNSATLVCVPVYIFIYKSFSSSNSQSRCERTSAGRVLLLEEKKRKKRADARPMLHNVAHLLALSLATSRAPLPQICRCRLLEFSVFLLCQALCSWATAASDVLNVRHSTRKKTLCKVHLLQSPKFDRCSPRPSVCVSASSRVPHIVESSVPPNSETLPFSLDSVENQNPTHANAAQGMHLLCRCCSSSP